MKLLSKNMNKSIRNMLFLLVSALILVSATFAWFAVAGETFVDKFEITTPENVEILFSKASIPSTDVLYDLTADRNNLTVKTSADTTTLYDYVQNLGAWETSDNYDLDLYPGEFCVYKVEGNSSINGSNSLIMKDISCTSDNAALAFDNVYVYAVAYVSTNGGAPVFKDGTLLKFKSFMGDNTELSQTTIMSTSAPSGAKITYYYVIGMPGVDTNGSHQLLQQTGVSINIGAVTME